MHFPPLVLWGIGSHTSPKYVKELRPSRKGGTSARQARPGKCHGAARHFHFLPLDFWFQQELDA
jgi:hypothetical protein